MEAITFEKTNITGGFWKQKQDMIRNTTIYSVYNRFAETGRFEAFKFNWKEGMPNKPHIFWDSDVAKWIEGVAYLTLKKKEPELERIVDDVIDLIVEKQDKNGYFNSYFQHIDPASRFRNRDWHELYCAGHLMEAAVAYYNATGKDKFLKAMCRYADYIERRFKIDCDTAFKTPGHEEIELALVKLSECTGEKRYYELAEYFINERGKTEQNTYNQSDLPVRKITEAKGHAVRATYLYCAMADIARINGDRELTEACRRVFNDIYFKKMYITGGIGSTSAGEAFTIDYDLPNLLAYTETCASFGLAVFAHRMLLIENDRKYAETIEREIYNGFLSGVSLDGDSFFYENPLEVIPRLRNRDKYNGGIHFPLSRRQKVFGCSCCPPNVTRFIPSIADLIYTKSEEENTIFVQQYMQSESEFDLRGKSVRLQQTTNYPYDGKLNIKYYGEDAKIAVRIPEWSENYCEISQNGYAYYDVTDGSEIILDFGMPVYLVESNPKVEANCGKYAVMRGPIVYCMEGIDNGDSLRDIITDTSFFTEKADDELGVISLHTTGKRRKPFENCSLYQKAKYEFEDIPVKFIPYYAFANREECEMLVWFNAK